MSAIRKELMEASGLAPKRGEDENAFLVRLQKAIAEDIDEATWNGLSEKAQDWNNDAADALTKGAAMPAFPDAEKAEPEPAATTGRRRGAAAAPAPAPVAYVPKEDDDVIVTTKRGKDIAGAIVELVEGLVVINPDGMDGDKSKDQEFELTSVTVKLAGAPAAAGGASQEPDEPAEPEVGDTVEAVTMRDKVIVGNIVEMTDDALVLVDASGADHELSKARLKSLVVKVKNKAAAPAPAPAPAASSRRGGAAAAPAAAPAADDSKPKRASNAGVSVGARIRELVCDDFTLTPDQVAAQLTKEKLEFRPATVGMIFKDTQFVIAELKKLKKLK